MRNLQAARTASVWSLAAPPRDPEIASPRS
jgi:hypothetical protein